MTDTAPSDERFERIRNHIIADAESIDGEWGCCHDWPDMTPECSGYEAAVAVLALLSSIEAQLQEKNEEIERLAGAARKCLDEYPGYEELDPLRAALGLPLYGERLDLWMLEEPILQEQLASLQEQNEKLIADHGECELKLSAQLQEAREQNEKLRAALERIIEAEGDPAHDLYVTARVLTLARQALQRSSEQMESE